MKIRIFSKRYNVMLYVALPGIFLLTVVLILLYVLTPSLGIEDAQKRVRLYLQRELSQEHSAMLKKQGIRLPEYDMAEQWTKEINRINNLKFVSVAMKRPLPDILFGFESPAYVVQVIFLDENQQHNLRYFWLSWDGIDRETSKLIWFFSV